MRPILGDHPTLGNKVLEIIRQEISHGRLPPGARVEVMDLAARLGVSRSPVTGALDKLCGEGLVREVPRRGYFVSSLDECDVAALVEARLAFDLGIADRHFHLISPADIDRMRELLAQMNDIANSAERWADCYPRFVDRDFAFHLVPVQATVNPHLVGAYSRLNVHLHSARVAILSQTGEGGQRATLREHADILAAADAGDLAAYKQAHVVHALAAADRFRRLRRRLMESAAG